MMQLVLFIPAPFASIGDNYWLKSEYDGRSGFKGNGYQCINCDAKHRVKRWFKIRPRVRLLVIIIG